MDSPHFFVDRSLGGVQVPELLRVAGWTLTTLAEHYGQPADQDVHDVDWLGLCGLRGWPVLMKDEKIRYRAAERDALVSAGVAAFCLASGNIKSIGMAELFIQHREVIWEKATAGVAAIWVLSRHQARLTEL